MPLPGLHIELANGALGRVDATADGVAGLILTGTAVDGKVELNKVYQVSSPRDLTNLGISKEENPLAYKDVNAFYAQAGDGAELYLLLVSNATTLAQMCSTEDGSPLRKLIDKAKGRIRLVGVNRIPAEGYTPDTSTTGIDNDAVLAAQAAQSLSESYAKKFNPFRLFMPALLWDTEAEDFFKPRQASYNRVGFVLACDAQFESANDVFTSPAIGQVLGRTAAYPVNYSIARVKSGAIAAEGWLADGSTPEDSAGKGDSLHDAGYIFYRNYIAMNGYYLNDDPLATALTDDYNAINLGRVIDKGILIVYQTYMREINDSVPVDKDGYLPPEICKYYEGIIDNAIAIGMNDEISDFSSYVDPKQNILSSSRMNVVCKIVPKGILRDIYITLGFDNPALNT